MFSFIKQIKVLEKSLLLKEIERQISSIRIDDAYVWDIGYIDMKYL